MPIDLLKSGFQDMPKLPTIGAIGATGKAARDMTQAPPDLVNLWPEKQEISAAEQERRRSGETPWWAYIFTLPDQLLLGRSVRGFIRGLGSNSAINPFEAFARGLPGAELFDAELNTSFADLRKAFGDYDAEEGALNFAVNLTGDILTDPSTWFMPFGATAKAAGAAGKNVTVKAGEEVVNAAQNAVPALTRKNRGAIEGWLGHSGLTLEEQVQMGYKAALVFHVPFSDVYKPVSVFDTKLDINLARSIDNLFGNLRSNPITGKLAQLFGSSGIRDPKQNALYNQWKNTAERAGMQLNQMFLMQLAKLRPEFVQQMTADPELMKIFSVLVETDGFKVLGDEGLLKHAIENREARMQAVDVVRRYNEIPEFKQLLDDAFGGAFDPLRYLEEVGTPAARLQGTRLVDRIPQAIDEVARAKQLDAIRKLSEYEIGSNGRKMRLPDELLGLIGLEAREGIEIPFGGKSILERLDPSVLDAVKSQNLAADASTRLDEASKKLIIDAGFDSYDEAVAAANGQYTLSGGIPSPDDVAKARRLVGQIDQIENAKGVVLKRPEALLERRAQLLEQAQAQSVEEIADRRRAVQVALSDARARGDTATVRKYQQLLRTYDRFETQVGRIDDQMRRYVDEPQLLRERFGETYTPETLNQQIDAMKELLEPRRVTTTEGEVLDVALGGKTLREATVSRVLDWHQMLQAGATTPKLAAIKNEIEALQALPKLEPEQLQRLRELRVQQRDLIKQGERFGGEDLKNMIVEAAEIHKATMSNVARAERAAGLINQTMEMYLPRIVNPVVRQLINDRFDAAIEKFGLKQQAESFLKGRKFDSLLTIEANILMEQLGSKVTDFAAVQDFVKSNNLKAAELQKALSSGVLGWTSAIFGPGWANKVIRPLDPEVADFFLANPALADYQRIKMSGRALTRPTMMQALFDSENGMVTGDAVLTDSAAVNRLINETDLTTDSLVLVDDERAEVVRKTIGEIREDITEYDIDARLGTIKAQLREIVKTRRAEQGVMPELIIKDLDDAISLVDEYHKTPGMDLTPSANDTEFIAMTKNRLRSLNEVRGRAVEQTETRMFLEYVFARSMIPNVGKVANPQDAERISFLTNRLQAIQKQVYVATQDADALQRAEVARAGEFFLPSAELKAKTAYVQELQQQSDAISEQIFDLHVANYDTGVKPGQQKMGRHGRRAVSTRTDEEILNDPIIRANAKKMYNQVLRDMHARTATMQPLDEVNALVLSAKEEIAVLEKARYARQASMLEGIGGKTTDDIDDLLIQRRRRLSELEATAKDMEAKLGYKPETTTRVNTVAAYESQVELAVAKYQKELAEVQRYQRAIENASDTKTATALQTDLEAQLRRVERSKTMLNEAVSSYVDGLQHTPHSTNLSNVIDALDDETVSKLAGVEDAPRRGIDEYVAPDPVKRTPRKAQESRESMSIGIEREDTGKPTTEANRRQINVAAATEDRAERMARQAYDTQARKQGRPLFDSLPPSRREELIKKEYDSLVETLRKGAEPRVADPLANDWLMLPNDYADAVKRNLFARSSLNETAAWYGVEDSRKAVADTKASLRGERAQVNTEARAANATLTEAERQVRKTINLARSQLKLDPATMANEVRHTAGMSDDGFMRWDQIAPEVQQRYLKEGRNNLRLVRMKREVLDSATKHINDLDKPDTLRSMPFVRALDQVRTWWSAATTQNPLFVQTRVRDMVQNLTTLMAAGQFSQTAFADANRISRAIGKSMKYGTSLREELGDMTIVVQGERRLAADVVDELQAQGTLGTSIADNWFVDEWTKSRMAKNSDPTVLDNVLGVLGIGTGQQVRPAPRNVVEAVGTRVRDVFDPENNPVYRLDSPFATGRRMARYGDDMARLTAALNSFEQGLDVAAAAMNAKKYVYGSGKTYTSFERNVLKRFLPFYGFMKWSTGVAMDLMVSNPTYLGAVSKVRDNAYRSLGLNEADMSEVVPSFLRDNVGIPVVNTPDGPQFITLGSVLPMQSLQDITNAVRSLGKVVTNQETQTSDAMLYIAKNMHPAAKLALEVLSNRDMFSGQEIQRYPGEQVEMFGIPMAPTYRSALRNLRYLADLDRLNVLDIPQLKVLANAVPRGQTPGERKMLPTEVALLTSSFAPVPVRAYQVDIREDARRARARDEQERNQLVGFLRQSALNPKPQAAENVETLRKLLASQIAEIDARQRVEQQYKIDPAEEDRKARELRKQQRKTPIRLTRTGYNE